MSTSSELEKNAGYIFQDRRLLDKALTHSSLQNKDYDNERLEFLGDRVLGLVVADMLFKAFPQEDEGHLARRHAALVQKAAIVQVAEAVALAPHIRLSSGELKAGGLRKDTILADALEALIGAIYLDGGFLAAETFVQRFWQVMLALYDEPPQDPKTALQEWAQARGLSIPAYRIVLKSGAEHTPLFEIEVSVETVGVIVATASSKRTAEKEAALKMLQIIETVEK